MKFSLQTCSELIKAGLKLSIESKRKMSGSDTDGGFKRLKKEESDDDYDSSHTLAPKNEVSAHSTYTKIKPLIHRRQEVIHNLQT